MAQEANDLHRVEIFGLEKEMLGYMHNDDIFTLTEMYRGFVALHASTPN